MVNIKIPGVKSDEIDVIDSMKIKGNLTSIGLGIEINIKV